MTANAALQQAKYNTERNVREELLAGNGFLNNRECAETTSGIGTNGVVVCKRWVTIAPGSIIGGGTLAALNSRLQQYEQADTEGKLTQYLPSVNELDNMSPEGDTTTGGYGPFDDYDGDGIPNWQDTDKDGDGIPDTNDPTPYLPDDATLPASVNFTYSKPATTTATSNLLTSTLTWTSSGAYCVADNNWLSADPSTPKVIRAVKVAGERLTAEGSIDIQLPLNFEAKLTRVRGGVTTVGDISTSTDDTRLGMLTILSVPSGYDGTAPGDKFQLSLNPFAATNTVEVTVPTDPAATGTAVVINRLKTAIETSGQFKNFTFSYQTAAGKIKILTEPVYQISCINKISDTTTSTTTKQLRLQK
jgi:hypothetical protein